MSAILGSPLGRVPFVRSEAASEGFPLTVENRFEFRFCNRLYVRLAWFSLTRMQKPYGGQSMWMGRGGTPTDWAMMGRSESREGWRAISGR